MTSQKFLGWTPVKTSSSETPFSIYMRWPWNGGLLLVGLFCPYQQGHSPILGWRFGLCHLFPHCLYAATVLDFRGPPCSSRIVSSVSLAASGMRSFLWLGFTRRNRLSRCDLLRRGKSNYLAGFHRQLPWIDFLGFSTRKSTLNIRLPFYMA